MQAPSFTISSDRIRAASSGGNMRIATSGAYTGVITKAKHVISLQKGTHGIEFDFKADNGATASFMTLWVMQADGTMIEGFQGIADAIAFSMKVREYTPAQMTITEYDFSSRQDMQVSATVYPELMNKRVGLVLQSEEYENNQGDTKTRMNIVGAFDANTQMVPVEVMDKAEKPELLDKIVASLKDKKLTTRQPSAAHGGHSQPSQQQGGFEDFDSIPF